jgi:hypothetical protein
MTSHINCRKCGGPHFTIKCNKDKKNIPVDNPIPKYINKNKFITYRVKISELPSDLTEKEMMEQLYEWGDIIRLKVLNHSDISIVFIDFKFEDQADYFVKALNKTDYDHHIISVSRINNNEDLIKK